MATARGLACRWHAEQKDQAGEPYVAHLERVAAAVARLGREAEDMAWLHDSLEDAGKTVGDLRAAGMTERVVAGVLVLTHRPGEPREAYCRRILECGDPLVLCVKVADLRDNADPGRLAVLPAETRERLAAKYSRDLARLGAGPAGRMMGL